MDDVMAVLREGLSSEPSLERPAGIEIRQELAPAGGLPVQPPSYEGRLEIHVRHVDGAERPTIELDSVGSCANRIEEVLLDLRRADDYPLPVSDTTVPVPKGEPIKITTLEAPHRLFDAWIRLSAAKDGDGSFEDSKHGREIAGAHLGALDPILEASTHDLLFGTWDSHRKGPHGQLRVARSLTSSLVGFDPVPQAQFAARRDPLNLGEASVPTKDAKKLSEQGLSSIPPQRSVPFVEGEDGKPKEFGGKVTDHRGGVSIESARYAAFLSFPALRRLGFADYDDTDVRVLLATLALYATALRCAQGWDLRARCTLLATGTPSFEIVAGDGSKQSLELTLDGARELFDQSAKKASVKDRSVHLSAGDYLGKLVADSVTSTA